MTPTERFLAELTQRECNPRRNGKGWSARCPAHEDRNPSLSVREGDDGRALVKCHAGCSLDAICGVLGMKPSDLFPSTSTQPGESQGNGKLRRRRHDKTVRTYQTADDGIAALDAIMAKEKGRRIGQWTYHDANGKTVALVLRYDLPTREGEKQKKTYRPVSLHDDGWRLTDPPGDWPLYGLPDLASAEKVYICEGEKAVDAARSIGLTATTSAHGAQSPDKTDWSPLAGKECVILPDNDAAGRDYANAVQSILAKLSPPAQVKVVHLPDLPEGGDLVDWFDAHGDAAEPDELRQQLEAHVDEADAIQPDAPVERTERFQPFPTDALPEPIRSFVVAGAKAIGCDSSFLALPMLSVLAAAVGNARCVQLKRGWFAPAIIWTAIVGESGTSKTPAFKLVMRPIRDRQRKALERHVEEMKQYEAHLAHYEKAQAIWKRDKNTEEPPPTKPDPPPAERFVVSDTTVEALAPLLLANPRGLLMARDELAGWLGSFDRYSAGKGGADASHWLSMFNGESIVVDRKTGIPRTIYVPRASMSVTGGIQPGILHRALGTEHRESGLAARLLLTCPPRKPKKWSEADIDPNAEAEMTRLFDRLYDLQPTANDDGNECPVVLGLTRDAKAVWIQYYNHHAKEQNDLSGDLSAAWSKLEEYAARLALVIHCARWAANDPDLQSPDAVDAESMKAGIVLAKWFKAEARRVYALLSESDDDREDRQLVEWIERKGASVTAREVQQGHRKYKLTGQAEMVLDELVKAGWGEWHDLPPGPKGGRPSREFRLSTLSTSTQPAKTLDSEGFVDVDSVDTPETQSDQDWGEM